MDISRYVRRDFSGERCAGATYIDLYSGPGRVKIRGTNDVMHGSPLVAWLKSVEGGFPFTEIHLADENSTLLAAAEFRLRKQNAPVFSACGPAIETVNRILQKLHPSGLHFAFLDPFSLGSLSFEVIRKLAGKDHMDILIHVSSQDLNRNLTKNIEGTSSSIEEFAPGWRKAIDVKRPMQAVRVELLKYWKSLLVQERMTTAEAYEHVTGPRNQPLYWLAFAARHDKAVEFWNKIRSVDTQMKLL